MVVWVVFWVGGDSGSPHKSSYTQFYPVLRQGNETSPSMLWWWILPRESMWLKIVWQIVRDAERTGGLSGERL